MTGDRDDDGRERELPGVRDSADTGACLVGGLLDRAVTFCEAHRLRDTAERAPGEEGGRELVLHRHHHDDTPVQQLPKCSNRDGGVGRWNW
ncbi:hypothetical protein [Streptomyces sviceus]|uniref:hypothetical protein n=1 Tax=Streptomyces sviceus TaxID=285530 RepID=UPI00332D1F76